MEELDRDKRFHPKEKNCSSLGWAKRGKMQEREDGWVRLGTDVASDDLSDCLSLFPECLGVAAAATLAWDKHIRRPVN